MALKSGYTSGYSGYIPGEKWRVGGRPVNNDEAFGKSPFASAPQTEDDHVQQAIAETNTGPQEEQVRCGTCGSIVHGERPKHIGQSQTGSQNAASSVDHSRRQAYMDHQKEADKFGEDSSNPFYGMRGNNSYAQSGNSFGRAAYNSALSGHQQQMVDRNVPAPGFTGHIPGMKENGCGRSYGAAAEMSVASLHEQQTINLHNHAYPAKK